MKKFLIPVLIGALAILFTFSSSLSSVFAQEKISSPISKTTETTTTEEEDEEEADDPCTEEGCEDEVEEVCEKDTETCGAWSECSADGIQKRTCKILDDCPPAAAKPSREETQKCKYVAPAPSPVEPVKKDETDKEEALKKAAEEKAKEEEAAREKAEVLKKALLEQQAAEKKADEELARKLKAEAEKAALEAAQRQAEEEIKRIREEQLRKQFEEEERKKAEEQLARKLKEEAERLEALKAAAAAPQIPQIPQTPAQIFVAPPAPVVPLVQDTNNNGVPDHLETFATRVDEDFVKIKAGLKVEEVRLTGTGQLTAEAEKEVAKKIEKIKVEKKRKSIREAGKKRGIEIKNSRQGTERDGTSDEVVFYLGMDPREKASPQAALLPLEKKLLRIKDPSTVEKKCSMSIGNGEKLSSKGFSILAACPRNKSFNLVAVDSKGKETIIETKAASENGKIMYTIDKQFSVGNFVFQLKEQKNHPLGFLPSAWFASALDANEPAPVQSDPVLVHIVEDTEIPQPVVQSIEGIDVAGLQDIKITATADGKIRVTGLADISTMVIGTFSSAVFTSAILADVDTGSFEVVSPRALEAGNHEVVIYATKPEDSVQSPPVKLRFGIIQTAQAQAPDTVLPQRPVAIDITRKTEPSQKFPIVPVLVFAGLAALFIGIGLYLKKNKGHS